MIRCQLCDPPNDDYPTEAALATHIRGRHPELTWPEHLAGTEDLVAGSTVRWFGPGELRPQLRIERPKGELVCAYCQKEIAPNRVGLRLPRLGHEERYTFFHLPCFLDSIGVVDPSVRGELM